jgi:two-component system phosphate regulon sensor histidine kinase PhoR
MRPILTILSLLGLLWVGGLLALTLHRARSRLGLAPLAMYLGGLVTILQMPGLGTLDIQIAGIQFRLASHVILPTILLGLLVVYIVDGTVQARPVIQAMILVAFLMYVLQIYLPIFRAFSSNSSFNSFQEVYPLRALSASTLSLLADVILLVITYQATSNLLRRFPSIFAGELALWSTLTVDALLFTSINFAGTPQWGPMVLNDWVAKTLAGLALYPLNYVYIKIIAPTLPDTAATTPRPTLDVFNTQVELEARMRLQYGLLYTLSQINQLIMKAVNAQSLFEQACTWLAAGRDLQLVWIGLRQEGYPSLSLAAKAGTRAKMLNFTGWLNTDSSPDPPAWLQALQHGQAIIEPDLNQPSRLSNWRVSALQGGMRALAAFPMRYHQKPVGVLCLMSTNQEAFNNPQEVQLFQELADDLAFAFTSLEARQRQNLLESSAENMRDGMLIMNRRGTIRYANPALAEMLGYSVEEMQNRNILNFILRDQAGQYSKEFIQALRSERKYNADLEFTNRQGRLVCISVRAILSLDEKTNSEHVVLSAHEITERRAYEKQIASLYQSEHNQRQLAEALVQAGTTLNSSLDLNEVLNQILEQIIRVVACQSVNLMLVEGENVRVVRHLDHRDPQEVKRVVTGLEMPLSLPTLQHMLETGQPLLIANTSQSPLWKDIGQTSWIRSYAAAPLQVRGQVIGFLNINSDQPNFFTEETTRSLLAFATFAATAIQNARLYRDLQTHNVELEERVQERTSQLRAAKDKIERILLSVPDAVFVLDDNHHVIQANPAGENLLVMAADEQMELFSEDFLQQISQGNIPVVKGILELGGNAYQALASPLPGADQNHELVVVFRDVTRFQELDRMKTQFVSDVSHELRTPLTNQTIYLDLLKNTQDPARRQKYLDILERETSRLTDLIEDLLMISRLEADRVQIKLEPVDLNTLMQDLVNDRLSLAQKRRLELTFQPGTDLPPLLTDPRLLIQVISNLLTNALNYTPAGGMIQLRTSLQEMEGACWQTVAIEDSGYGIQSEEKQRIFERFFRGSASKLSEAPGTGLGLAISKEILERMGGKITLTSEPGQGSNFTVWVKAVL